MAQITVMITQTYDTSDFTYDGADEDINTDDLIDKAYDRFAESIENMVKYGEVWDNIVAIVQAGQDVEGD